MTRLEESLSNQEGNYIFPFFWQHGEEESVLREYMQAIAGANLSAVCIESRPHPDFAGPRWWHDMDIILDEAVKRNMKVWILDDSHFPTGYANGAVKTAPDELTHQYLVCRTLEMSGPAHRLELDLAEYMQPEKPLPWMPPAPAPERVFHDDRLVKVLACPIEAGEKLGLPIDLTETADRIGGDRNTADRAGDRNIADRAGDRNTADRAGDRNFADRIGDRLIFDLPDGYYRIYVIRLTRNARGRNDYINFMDPDSCRLLIDAVYEPHLQHYAKYFGSTIAGFFSDEPPIGNTEGYLPAGPIGTPGQNLPWSKLAAERFTREFGSDGWLNYLPYLWADASDAGLQAKERTAYMDMVTKLAAECFSAQLGGWCRAHGVEYIGHMLEDCDINTDLGISMGHFFRGLSGQDMAGIDNIGGQVMVNAQTAARHPNSPCVDEAGFYHYLMAKLGASLAAIDPKKKGRCMCENFGAYGWQFGMGEFKFMVDSFLARGVNRFVPHAFSPAAFPDPDCPPHFYAHGENPEYPAFGALMSYTNRICHLIDGGRPCPDVALLYNAEGKWSGRGDSNIPAARSLATAQVDFHVLPADVFRMDGAYPTEFDGRTLRVNGIAYQALLISGCDYLDADAAAFVREALQMRYPVVFLDRVPCGIAGASEEESRVFAELLTECLPAAGKEAGAGTPAAEQAGDSVPETKETGTCVLVPAVQAGAYCRQHFAPQAVFTPEEKKLVSCHYRNDLDLYLILNENAEKIWQGSTALKTERGQSPERLLMWNPWENRVEECAFTSGEDGRIRAELTLQPLELAVLIPLYGKEEEPAVRVTDRRPEKDIQMYEINSFCVQKMGAKEYTQRERQKEGAAAGSAGAENGSAGAETGSAGVKTGTAAAETACDSVTAPFSGMQEQYPEFSGYYIYETELTMVKGRGYRLTIADLYDSAEVFLNGKRVGMRLQRPYTFELTEAAEQEQNLLRITVATTLERKVKAMGADIHSMSAERPLSPTGIVGKVTLTSWRST